TGVEELAEDRAARTIRAEWLEALAAKPDREVRVPIQIENAIIEGPVDLIEAVFQYGVSIKSSEWTDPVDLSFATFSRGADFGASSFKGLVSFRGVHARRDLTLVGARFSDHAHFMDLRVDEAFATQGAQFRDENFDRAQFSKGAFLSFGEAGQQTKFAGTVRFHSSVVKSVLIADGAIFESDLVLDATLVDGQAFFKGAVFSGETRFTNAVVSGNAECRGCQFNGIATFDRTQIGGGASFRAADNGVATRFARETSF